MRAKLFGVAGVDTAHDKIHSSDGSHATSALKRHDNMKNVTGGKMSNRLILGLTGALALWPSNAWSDQMGDIAATQEMSIAIQKGDLNTAENSVGKIGDPNLKNIGYANVFAKSIEVKDCRRAGRVLNFFTDPNLKKINEINYKMQCG